MVFSVQLICYLFVPIYDKPAQLDEMFILKNYSDIC